MNFDIIGDIHGCFEELQSLTEKLGYSWGKGVPLHPTRTLGFVGDLTDRGPNSLKVVEIVYDLVFTYKRAHYAPGNHCNKLYRYFLGRNVQIIHGLETTVAEYESLSPEKQEEIKKKFIHLYEESPLYQQLDDNRLIICHAGIKESLIGQHNGKVKTFVLYGDITGEKHPDGRPVRRDWAEEYEGKPIIVYGHTPVNEPIIKNNTYNIDTGCVFGGALTALSYPERIITQVPSSMPYVAEKFS